MVILFENAIIKGKTSKLYFDSIYISRSQQILGGKGMRKFKYFVLLVLLVALVACGGDDDTTATDDTTDDETEEVVDETDGESEDEVEEEPQVDYEQTPEMDFDLGGRTITLVSWYDEEIAEDSPDSIAVAENLAALKEKHNFEVEYEVVDYGEFQEAVTASLVAGDPLGDIIRIPRPWMIPTLTRQGLFHPVDEYVVNENSFVLQYTEEHSEYEGRGYGFRTGTAGAAGGVFYNRTLMNELNLDPLQDYVDNDEWNWETFMEVAQSANQDTDNDGNVDVWGLATNDIAVQALAANEATFVRDGQVTLEEPETIETLEFISDLGDIARPTEGGDWTEPQQFFLEGNVLMFVGQDYQMDDFKDGLPEHDIGFLPFPMGPNASSYQTHITIPNYYTIPSAVEDPDKIVYIWEKMTDIESIYDYPEQAGFETFFSNEDDINNARLAIESFQVIEQIDYYPSMEYYEFIGEVRDGNPISTVIETYQANWQAAVDEVWAE